jgi:hypothetical protein
MGVYYKYEFLGDWLGKGVEWTYLAWDRDKFKHGNENFVYMTCGEFLGFLRDC